MSEPVIPESCLTVTLEIPGGEPAHAMFPVSEDVLEALIHEIDALKGSDDPRPPILNEWWRSIGDAFEDLFSVKGFVRKVEE